MTIPDFQTLMLPVLQASADGEVHIGDVVEKLAAEFSLSEEERAHLLPSGRQTTFANRVHWSKSYLRKARLVALSGRGRFIITDRGREVLAAQPKRIDIKFLQRFPEFATFRNDSGSGIETENDDVENLSQLTEKKSEALMLTPDETIRVAYRRLEAALAEDLLSRVRQGTPAFFERVIVQLLMKMNYGGSVDALDSALTGGSGDGGIDGVIDQDPLGLDRIYVQAKRYGAGSVVGRPEVQGFVGSLVGLQASKGVFVTTSTFSRQALDYARSLQQRVILIDGARLTELMVEFGVGVRASRVIEVRRLDEDYFSDEG
jgi:restriction system protein